MWLYQYVLRDFNEAYQKVSIFINMDSILWTYKETDIKKINNKEIFDISNNRDHSFITFIIENSDPYPSSKQLDLVCGPPLL